MAHYIIITLMIIFQFLHVCTSDQAEFFTLMKNSSSFLDWDTNGGQHFCTFKGVGCDNSSTVIKIDLTGWGITTKLPENLFSYLPGLRILRFGRNYLQGNFPISITNCSYLEELNMSSTHLTGPLPDFSPLQSLRLLDLSYNHFHGDFPMSFTNLSNLEYINFIENDGFNNWELPQNISNLKNLKTIILSTCKIQGTIPSSIGFMTSLIDLELSGNYLRGPIPVEIGQLKNLKQLQLYYNHLEGEIPKEIGNLTELQELDVSVNNITKVHDSIWALPSLRVLQLYNNSITGQIPDSFGNSTTLGLISIYENFFTGEIPRNLGRFSPLIGFDLSENQFSGELPANVCNGGKLMYILVLGNMISGEIPATYANCLNLLRFRVSHNLLIGRVPEWILALPHMSIFDVGYNGLNGSIPNTIGNAKNLSELIMPNNMISGSIPVEISLSSNLVKIELSNNLLSGPIPFEIGNLKLLNSLLLNGNKLNSSIPSSLSSLKSLNVLDLSSNLLTGKIPENLSNLLPNSMNFSNNLLNGPIPISFVEGGVLESFSGNPNLCLPTVCKNASAPKIKLCPQVYNHKKTRCFWLIGISVGILTIGIVLFLKGWFRRNRRLMDHEDSLSSSYKVKSFYRLSFDQQEIIESMIDKNIVGYGGSGTVYRIALKNGETVAVKKLWMQDKLALDKELKSEVETLGTIRHKNIVKLYCYFSSMNCNLLVYEYMINGNLWDAIHGGSILLNWPARYEIALGVAQGLSYLHHDLMPPIIHRDIKSNNILLDSNYEPKVADFGIAKVLQGIGKDSTTTTGVAGTYGYLAPEYAYSSKATTKCDVYSFGVVLMELITGKKPVEPEYGENNNIIYWISAKLETKGGVLQVLDKRISASFKDEMIKVLKIAIRCTSKSPGLRPTMNEVVQLLIEADPCNFDSSKFNNKSKETFNVSKPKEPF